MEHKGIGKNNRIGRVLRGGASKVMGLQTTIMLFFTAITIGVILILGLTLYFRFSVSTRQSTIENTGKILEQTQENLEDYLLSMRQISDAVYFNVIQEYDVSDPALERELSLIYESHKDRLLSVAMYDSRGSLVAAVPVVSQKREPNVTKQQWFIDAMDQIENMHFSMPHVQNLFDDSTYDYHRVISLSRAIEINDSDRPRSGVLLVDMNYSAIAQFMEQINQNDNGQYYYLCDKDGNLIYHPRQMQIQEGIAREDSEMIVGRPDGTYKDSLDGEKRNIIVNTISYTGWKLVGVIPNSAFNYGIINTQFYFIMIVLVMAMMMLLVNRIIARRISRPILKLNDSVKAYEAGEKPQIYISGPTEIRHLGRSVQSSYERIDLLMKQIVEEQTERRKSEIDALQSQINPHFLYNTLDSVIWMVESGKNNDAVYMISELAKLLRISLSKGRTIIRLEDELQHCRSYMNIQKIRYKDKFAVEYEIDPQVNDLSTVKLIIQPILENAIYYGVGDMDEDDGGKIIVSGRLEGDDVVIDVSDNGQGMPEEEAERVLTDDSRVHKHGNGVGLVNVHKRIQLLFGKEYGLKVESELDQGTTVSIRLPAIPYTDDNRHILEQGKLPVRGGDHE